MYSSERNKELKDTESADNQVLRDKEKLLKECPDEREALRDLLKTVNSAKERNVCRQDFEKAAALRDFEREIQMRIRKLPQPTA